MTDLQTSLIGIGIAIVIGVIVYNKWQEYRVRKHVERAFPDPVDDVLMNSSATENTSLRQEPVLDHFVASNATKEPILTGSQVFEKTDSLDENRKEEISIFFKTAEPPVDELIDYPIVFNLEENVGAEKLLPVFQSLRFTGSKPIHFIGLINDKTKPEYWQIISSGNSYSQLKAVVQLTNRSSALNEIEFSELLIYLKQIADAIGAELDIPEMSEVIERSRQLFQFVSDHDAKLGISIRSNSAPWQLISLNTALEKQGLERHPDGLFIMRDKNDGAILFTLSTNELPASEIATRLTILMDVPCVAAEKEGFRQMIQFAKSLCVRLDGSLIDDGNQLLTDSFLDEISGQVNAFYDEMSASSIPAGSIRALRLFN